MSQSALVLVEFNFYDELTKLGTNSKVNRLLKALFIVLDLMHPKLCSQEFWNFSMNFLSEYKENIGNFKNPQNIQFIKLKYLNIKIKYK